MKTIVNTIFLLLAATACFAQVIIEGDPTEPCGPVRPDYWIGRHDRNPIQNVEIKSKAEQPRQATKRFSAALTDSYNFGTDTCVNDDPPGSGFATPYSSGGHAMAARGDTVYLVWRDDRSGTSRIYFDKSTNGGNTWGTDVKVNDGDSAAIMPALALGQDGTIYASWTDFRHITRQIYFSKSIDGGNTFTPGIHVQPATPDKQQYSSIAVNDSGYVFIAYEDFRNLATTAIDIYCSRSIDGGTSFEPAVRVDDCPDSINQWYPCLANQDSNVYVVWEDFRDTSIAGQRNIYIAISNNNGDIFGFNKLINDTIGIGSYSVTNPSLSVSDNYIFIAWQDTRNSGQNDIFFTKSNDNGQTFIKPDKNIIDVVGATSTYYQGYPSLCCDDSGGVYCAWEDRRNGSAYPWLIYFNYSKNYGDSFATNNIHVDDINIGSSPNVQLSAPTIYANNKGKVFCAWEDNRLNPGGLPVDIYATAGMLTGIEGKPGDIVCMPNYKIKAYPNPFKNTMQIEYSLSNPGKTILGVYNITGQLVKVLDKGYRAAGSYKINWPRNNLSAGIYFICLHDGERALSKKIIKIK